MATFTARSELIRKSTKILGNVKDSNSFVSYLSKKQIDIIPLLENENKLVNQILEFRDSERKI